MGEDVSKKGVIFEGDSEINLGSEKSFFDTPISKGIGLDSDIKETLGPILKALKFKDIGSSFDPNKPVSAEIGKPKGGPKPMNLFGGGH